MWCVSAGGRRFYRVASSRVRFWSAMVDSDECVLVLVTWSNGCNVFVGLFSIVSIVRIVRLDATVIASCLLFSKTTVDNSEERKVTGKQTVGWKEDHAGSLFNNRKAQAQQSYPPSHAILPKKSQKKRSSPFEVRKAQVQYGDKWDMACGLLGCRS